MKHRRAVWSVTLCLRKTPAELWSTKTVEAPTIEGAIKAAMKVEKANYKRFAFDAVKAERIALLSN